MQNFRIIGLSIVYDHSGSTFTLATYSSLLEAKMVLEQLSCPEGYYRLTGEKP
jgi:hypothetical protein